MSFSAFLSKVSVTALFVVAPTVFAATANPPKYAPEGDVEAGKALAESRGCAGCHGEAGNSDTPSYPKLTGLGEKYLLKQLKDVQSGKRVITLMPD